MSVPDGLGYQTDRYISWSFEKVRNNKKVIAELSKKITRLMEDPYPGNKKESRQNNPRHRTGK
jgi:hypothetical protein